MSEFTPENSFEGRAQPSLEDISVVRSDDVQLGLEPPSFPKKTLYASLGLFLVGTLLIVFGFVDEIVDTDPTRGIAMWVLGVVTFLPGFYYSFLFYKAYRAKDASERMRILREIPEL
mmetsp:Transcript_8698/g.12932  ORF Transcript_8698/g.12932 Transcript_8698/m.12932 type:complete len:117 (+) Transcript_8698:215-565(+)